MEIQENKLGLGRIPAFDPRDAKFMLPKMSVQKVGRRHFHVVTAKALANSGFFGLM
ncbi:MAG: hypothetical protein ACR2MD_03185 [Aridibacter sp.]